MNKQTREFLLELKANTQLPHTLSMRSWTIYFNGTNSSKESFIVFKAACKLMVACGFGDEII